MMSTGDPAVQVLARRSYDLGAQNAFAALSGDRNPLHLDRGFGRRSPAGDIVVHGAHILLWVLEEAARAGLLLKNAGFLDVVFAKPLYLNEAAELTAALTGVGQIFEVRVGGLLLMTATISREASVFKMRVMNDDVALVRSAEGPLDRSADDLSAARGAVTTASLDDCRRAFPSLTAEIGAPRIAGILAMTKVVGMECPGLYSMLSNLKLRLTAESETDRLLYAVERYDRRFRSVRLAMRGCGIEALVNAFSPKPPVAQATAERLASIVGPTAFAGQRALVIGGSRGLGEVTAKAIAAGGGDVIVTYANGQAEAEAVAADIQSNKGKCTLLRYNALELAGDQIAKLSVLPTHVYYFATPRIFRRNTTNYDPALLHEFLRFYVDGFASLIRDLSSSLSAAFYPSSVAVVENVKGLSEYGMAKAAGEKLCSDLRAFLRGPDIIVKRLPRVATDQTATVSLVEELDAVEVMLPIIADMHRAGRLDATTNQ